MKKIISVLLAVGIIFSLAACGKSSTTTSSADPQTPDASKTSNQIVYGVTSSFAGDWGFNQWSSSGGDKPVLALMDAYAPTCYDQDAQWIWDETVVESGEIKKNDDGTETYTVVLNQGLKFSDGKEITAKNYVAFPLLFSSPAAKEAKAYGTAGVQFLGHSDYINGTTPTFKGLKLIDDYTFEITIGTDYVPYYYGLAFLNFFPIDYTMWLGEGWDVLDDGQGAYFKGGVDFTPANCGTAINNGRFIYTNRVCSGPYLLESFDAGANEAVLKINPNYAGNFEGKKASIETIVIKVVDKATMMDALKTGAVDIIDGIGEGSMINAALDLADTGDFATNVYTYSGYMKLFYQCDWGPTQFESVRKAVAYLTNREEISQEVSLGYGTVVNGQYSFAQWMAQDLQEELSTKLEAYSYNPEKAVELLKADGWVFNADGTDYVDGSGLVRYKEVTEAQTKYGEANCVKLANGKWLMGLVLEYCGHAQGEGFEATLAELLAIYLCEAKETVSAGMKINRTVMADGELLSYLNRRGADGDAKYESPSFNFISLASGLNAAKFDRSYSWTSDPDKIASNKNRYFNEVLDKASMDMIYGTEAGDDEAFKKVWLAYQIEYNRTMPEVPLFNWAYCAVFNKKLQGFEENNIWSFPYAILYATVA